MQSCSLRTSAFSGSQLRAPCASTQRSSLSARAPVVVRAVQDVQGTVVSTAMNKTIIVAVERLAPHDKYFKRIRSTKRYFAHNESTDINIGDYVRLQGCRPLSRNKRFELAEVIRKAN